MRKKIVWCCIGVVFVVSSVWSFLIVCSPPGHRVEIVQEDVVVKSIDLDHAKNEEFVVYYGESSNTIHIEDGEIWVSQAQCPDHICMKMGKLSSENLPIVCLPNHLIIRFAE